MLLAIDIGNSSIRTGVFSGNLLLDRMEIPAFPKKDVGHYRAKLEKFLADKEGNTFFEGAIISSVVPGLTDTLASSAREVIAREPLILTSSLDTGLTFDVEEPEEIGTDRIANAVAARELFGSPAAAVDFGTATTITAVKDRKFLGGAIMAGLRLMGETLHRGTARLPSIDTVLYQEASEFRVRVLGKSTTASMISGIIYGSAGAVERILEGMEAEEKCTFRIVLTGGHSGMMARFIKRQCYTDRDLTLTGLRLIYERNCRCTS